MSNKQDVKEVLTSAGWFEGRKIDTTSIEKKYCEFGYEAFPAVLKFLEEFGDHEIINTELEERHHTSPENVLCAYFKHGKFTDEERYAGERLVIVGETCDRNLLLFVSESGKIYNGTGKLGDSNWEAWDAIINKTGENYKAWGRF